MTKPLGLTVSLLILLASLQCTQKSDINNQVTNNSCFNISIMNDVETFDPLYILYNNDWQMASFVYEGLVAYQIHSTEITPWLAKQIQLSNLGKTITMHLRTSVFFHNDPCFPKGQGRRLTAKDVVYTFDRILNKKTEAPNAFLLADKIKNISALNDSTIQFELNNTYANFLKILASPICYIVPEEAVNYYHGDLTHHPVGTGPFQLIHRNPFQSLQFIKNRQYWRKDNQGQALPHLSSIFIQVVGNHDKIFDAFIKGANMLHLINNETFRQAFDNLEITTQFQEISTCAGLSLRFLGFSMDKSSPYTQNADLRTAIALNYDRESVQSITSSAQTVLACSVVPPELLNLQSARYPYNPVLASHLAASFSDAQKNNDHPFILMSNIESTDIHLMKQGLDNLNIQNQIIIDKTRYYEKILEHRPELFRVSFMPSFPDPQEYYSLFYSKSPKEINLTGYRNSQYDRYFEEAQIETDLLKRQKLFAQMETILKQDVPLILISHSKPTSYIIPSTVQNFRTRYTLYDLSEVKLESVQ